jgi:hypothetical protein
MKYNELTNMPAIWIEPVLTNVCVNYGNVNFNLSANSKAPNGASWSITPTNGVTLTGYSTYSVVNVGSVATSYVIRATSVDNTNIFGLAVLNVVYADMTAYRPQTEGPGYGSPFQKQAITNSLEEDPGAGIRVNGDDDNNNSTADSSDTSVSGENDLIEVELKTEPYPASGLTYILKRSNSNIKVWNSQSKGTALLDSGTEAEITFSASTKTVWVENPSGGSVDLEFIVRSGETDICSDKVHFYSFENVVIAIGGENQDPTDPPDAGHGTFAIATNLYMHGYDVHMFNEDGLYGVIHTEVSNAIVRRGVSNVAIIGYSHGGGATHDLAETLAGENLGSWQLSFTAYIDAVAEPAAGIEDQRPTNSVYHVNYYQTPHTFEDLWLGGGPMQNPPGANVEVNVSGTGWGTNLTHFTIDDAQNVKDGVYNELINHVNPW